MDNLQKSLILFPVNVLYLISPKLALKLLFRLKQGYRLNLNNPNTYNEKLQWMKLNYKNPLITKLVDKYTVRDFVAGKCPEILNKLLWQGFDAKEIPWDTLPEKFVIKVTHGSGFNIICTDKDSLDKNKCVKKLNKWLKAKFIKCYGEWFYGVEKPRIIIEEYLDTGTGIVPTDYKVMCFDGEPKFFVVDTDRFTGHKRNVYDIEWNFLEGVSMDFPNDEPMDAPTGEVTRKLLYYARTLSEGFPHVRIDLYVVKDEIFFGEMTFTNGAGFDRFRPYRFDAELGELFNINSERGF
jgi:hypothetical protein